MSSHLQWMCIRNNSAFLYKGAHGKTFSTVNFLIYIHVRYPSSPFSMIIPLFGSSDLNSMMLLFYINMRKF
jgi:hypothetical protein